MNKRIKTEIYKLIMNGNLWDDKPDLLFNVECEDQNFDYSKLGSGKSVKKIWPGNFTIHVIGTIPVDFFYCGPYYKVASDNAKVIMEKHSERLEFLPIHVQHKNPRKLLPLYWVINVLDVLDVLDWEETYWTTNTIPYGDSEAYMNVIKPALIGNKIDKEIFHIKIGKNIGSGIFISNNLRKELIKANARLGMSFSPIKVT